MIHQGRAVTLVLVDENPKSYYCFRDDNGHPIARLRPTGDGDRVEVMRRSHRGKWEEIGDFGPMVMPVNDALDYIARDPCGCFWH